MAAPSLRRVAMGRTVGPPYGALVPLRRAATALAILALLLAGCFSEAPESTGPEDPEAVVIEMTPSLTFGDGPVEVRVGQTVRWENTSAFVHTATGDPARALLPSSVSLPPGAEPWDSGDVPAGGSFEMTFEVPGEYRYFCVPHEGAMSGTLHVLP